MSSNACHPDPEQHGRRSAKSEVQKMCTGRGGQPTGSIDLPSDRIKNGMSQSNSIW
jgi:hypothetical protein